MSIMVNNKKKNFLKSIDQQRFSHLMPQIKVLTQNVSGATDYVSGSPEGSSSFRGTGSMLEVSRRAKYEKRFQTFQNTGRKENVSPPFNPYEMDYK